MGGKSEKSDSESRSKSSKSSAKSGHVIQKSKSKSDIPDIATMVHSDITTDEEVVTSKITSRRNSSKESRDELVHGNSQRKNISKSILDTESDSGGRHSGSGSDLDSDSPRKHSIFDIDVDDGKTDMYDKIKARREAYMKKQ